ncbi:hypothetical protein EB796_009359 [Bugula neritina]|uniref:BAIAP3 n=1 Tax=Bugula neritina TaxID=10212 RepID=A0A7J7K416_BUGNE|nr:hypothetical protein EB796_009359 [Bugula neritina]
MNSLERTMSIPESKQKRLRFLHSSTAEEETISAETLSIYSNERYSIRFSDPYCMLGIIPGSRAAELSIASEDQSNKDSKSKSLLRKLSGSLRDKIKTNSKDKPTHIIPAKFIQSTKVISNSLNPVWEEKFKFDIEDVKSDKLHIDVWDHDDEESVFDAAKSLNQAKSFKGLGRVFKQIAQSARASSGENIDDFLGAVDISLHDVPSTGRTDWYDLCARSAKSKVHGQIQVSLQLATREDHGIIIDDNFNDVRQHEDLLLIFIDNERELFTGNKEDWRGSLSVEADTILHQHAIQGDITPVQKAFCYWIAYSQKFRDSSFDSTCLLNILKNLNEHWNGGVLSGEEEARLGQSFKEFIEYFLKLISQIRIVYPVNNPHSVEKLERIVECVKFLIDSDVYAHCCPLSQDIKAEISHCLKNGTKGFFNKVQESIYHDQNISMKDKIGGYMKLCKTLYSDVNQSLETYHTIFYRLLHVPYFDAVYRTLERKLSSELRKLLDEELSTMLLSTEETHNGKSSDSVVTRRVSEVQVSQNDAKNLLISSILNLYFCVQRFADLKVNLVFGRDTQTLAIDRYQDWFSRSVQEWLTLSKAKLEARIQLAVQQDKTVTIKLLNSEDNFECSTSAVDVVSCYTQIAEFWKKLKWRNEEELFAFSLKLADDICQSAVLYTDLLHSKMKKNSYFDDEGQFDVQKPLCTCLNDLEYIRKMLVDLPSKLNLSHVISAIEQRHNIESEGNQPTHFHEVFQSLIDQALDTMKSRLEFISQKVSDRMRPDIKKNVFHLCWSPEKNSVHEAIEPLIEYLDNNLLTLYTYLLRRNFKCLLMAIWQECLEELQEVVKTTEERNAKFFSRIQDALVILVDFFNADDKGLLMEEINCRLYTGLISYFSVQQLTTEEIICQFYKDMIKYQSQTDIVTDNKFGTISFRTHYDRIHETLSVEVNSCSDIIALDSNGLSDPYIVWDLCPHHIFSNYPEFKTSIKKKTLNPVYDESFQCEVPIDDMQRDGACVRFTLMDYNFVVKNDFGGEAYVAMNSVPGVFSPVKAIQSRRMSQLVFMKPQTIAENPNLVALTQRTEDSLAQDFVSNREALADEAQIKIQEYEAMTSST